MHLLRVAVDPHIPLASSPGLVEIGASRCSSATTGSSTFIVIRDSTDAGSIATSTVGMKRPRTLSQNRLVANVVDLHRHHLASVRRVIPIAADSFVTDLFVGPRTSADASTTMAPT